MTGLEDHLSEKTPLEQRAIAEWTSLAPTLGLTAADFRCEPVWEKDETGRRHVVLRLKSPTTDLILKRVYETDEGASLGQASMAQQQAHLALKPKEDAHAPKVLFQSDDGDMVIMSYVVGKTADQMFLEGKPHKQILRRCGTWLSAYHNSGPIETRAFQPRFMLNHTARLADLARDGRMAVVEPEFFVRCCGEIPIRASRIEGYKTFSSWKHGDANLRNFILGKQGVSVIDFKPESTAPVGYDISRFLLDYAQLYQPPSDRLLSDETIQYFLKGYKGLSHKDPAFGFLAEIRLLSDWCTVPANEDDHSLRQSLRMAKILALARQAFPDAW
ncbi:MAG: phosphotransferase [Pseudoruegeria sp.]